jgi:hypothetical protein
MRFVYEAGSEHERGALRERFARLLEPQAALRLLRGLPLRSALRHARCMAVRGAKDRFVIRVEAEADDGSRAAYALKGYGDARGTRLAGLYAALAGHWARRGEPCPALTPLGYFADERLFVFPWLHGVSLAEAIAQARAGLVERAVAELPPVLARLHATPIEPEPATRAEEMLSLAVAHWESGYPRRFREARRAVVEPLMRELQAAAARLAPAAPALVHGDAGPGNFLYHGTGWRLLDLDAYGYADPAYDVGYLCAKLETQCLAQPALAARAGELMRAMRDACLAAMPEVSPCNVAFHYGMTLSRKTLAQVLRGLPREELPRFPAAAAPLLARIHAALGEAAAS